MARIAAALSIRVGLGALGGVAGFVSGTAGLGAQIGGPGGHVHDQSQQPRRHDRRRGYRDDDGDGS